MTAIEKWKSNIFISLILHFLLLQLLDNVTGLCCFMGPFQSLALLSQPSQSLCNAEDLLCHKQNKVKTESKTKTLTSLIIINARFFIIISIIFNVIIRLSTNLCHISTLHQPSLRNPSMLYVTGRGYDKFKDTKGKLRRDIIRLIIPRVILFPRTLRVIRMSFSEKNTMASEP